MDETLNNELRSAMDRWIAAFNNHDIDALMSDYDVEINYATHTAPRKVGIPAVREGFIAHLGIKPSISFKEEQVIASEQLGFVTGVFHITGTHPENNGKLEEAGRVVAIFRKSNEGVWKLVFDMDNRPPDVTLN